MKRIAGRVKSRKTRANVPSSEDDQTEKRGLISFFPDHLTRHTCGKLCNLGPHIFFYASYMRGRNISPQGVISLTS